MPDEFVHGSVAFTPGEIRRYQYKPRSVYTPQELREESALAKQQLGFQLAKKPEPEGWVEWGTKKTPFVGGAVQAGLHLEAYEASKRVVDGDATQQDYDYLAEYMKRAEEEQGRGWWAKTGNLIADLPGFITEMYVTGGAYTAGRKATEKAGEAALKRLIQHEVGKWVAKTAVGGGAAKAVGWAVPRAAGAAAQTAAIPTMVAENITRRIVPEMGLGKDDAGHLRSFIEENDEGFVEAIGKGALDAFIEVASERSGGLLGKAAGKVPYIRGLKGAIAKRLLAKGSTMAKINDVLKKGGWHGVLEEMGEERTGEVARGLTGVEDNYGVTGQLLSDPLSPEAWSQLSSEAVAFFVPGAASQVVGRVAEGYDKHQIRKGVKSLGRKLEIIAKVRRGETLSRKEWKEMGLPPEEGKSATDREKWGRRAKQEMEEEEAASRGGTGIPPADETGGGIAPTSPGTPPTPTPGAPGAPSVPGTSPPSLPSPPTTSPTSGKSTGPKGGVTPPAPPAPSTTPTAEDTVDTPDDGLDAMTPAEVEAIYRKEFSIPDREWRIPSKPEMIGKIREKRAGSPSAPPETPPSDETPPSTPAPTVPTPPPASTPAPPVPSAPPVEGTPPTTPTSTPTPSPTSTTPPVPPVKSRGLKPTFVPPRGQGALPGMEKEVEEVEKREAEIARWKPYVDRLAAIGGEEWAAKHTGPLSTLVDDIKSLFKAFGDATTARESLVDQFPQEIESDDWTNAEGRDDIVAEIITTAMQRAANEMDAVGDIVRGGRVKAEWMDEGEWKEEHGTVVGFQVDPDGNAEIEVQLGSGGMPRYFSLADLEVIKESPLPPKSSGKKPASTSPPKSAGKKPTSTTPTVDSDTPPTTIEEEDDTDGKDPDKKRPRGTSSQGGATPEGSLPTSSKVSGGRGGTGVPRVSGGSGTGLPGDAGSSVETGGRPVRSTEPGDSGVHHDSGRVNFAAGEENAIGEGGQKTKFRANLDAIRTLKKIEAEGRRATPEEQAILVRYTGWGGMPQAFDAENAKWAGEYAELKEALTDEEYKAARASTPNAHYTSPDVIKGIWDAVKAMGFREGTIVEPAMGVGLFYAFMPADLQKKSRLRGIELDSISGRISQQLYQQAQIAVAGFQDVNMQDNSADLFISNVPFANVKITDELDRELSRMKLSLHDYFFAKAMKKTRPGGLVVFITSRFTMDKGDASVRKSLAALGGDFVGAVRLPRSAFKQIANTEVVTDIVVFQKRVPGTPQGGQPYTNAVDVAVGDGSARINEYFVAHPEKILGTPSLAGTMYGANEYTVEPTHADLGAEVAKQLGSMPVDKNALDRVQAATAEANEPERIAAPASNLKDGSYVVQDGKLYQKQGSDLVAVDAPRGGTPTVIRRISAMIELRDAARDLLHKQVNPEATHEEIEDARKRLNEVYDAFVKEYGYVNTTYNGSMLENDPDLPLVRSLEHYDPEAKRATKATIFTKRTQFPVAEPASVDTPEKALVASLAYRGGVDPEYMAGLLGKPANEIMDGLYGEVFKRPDGVWEHKSTYLSGNVRRKLAEAERAAKADPVFAKNVEALKAAQPADIPPDRIATKLGASWIPPEVYAEFIDHLIGKEANIKYNALDGTWVLGITDKSGTMKEVMDWGTPRKPAHDLLDAIMNYRKIVVTDKSEGERPVVNQEETAAARAKAKAIEDEFRRWLFADANRAESLVRLYNDQQNNSVYPLVDGSHLELPGKAAHITMRPHQLNAIWRALTMGNTILAHSVGAGKTWVIAGISMEMRRLGIAKKPIIVVPNHLIDQFPAEFLQMYPGANILAATKKDFLKKNRQKFMHKIATGDWDAIIVPMSSFERIPLSPARARAFFDKQIEDLRNEIIEARKDKSQGNKNYIKELEKALERLSNLLKRQAATWKKDAGPYFDELGVDALFVDEAHEYKNLFYRTKMNRVAGAGSSEAQKTFDMHMKTEFLNETTGERNIVFATGTPISNSISEMYTMQRYLQPSVLAERGVSSFDAWASTFGNIVTDVEVSPEGGGFRIHSRFAEFVNIEPLMQMFRQIADVQTADDLKLPVPKMEGGKPSVVNAPKTEELDKIVQSLVRRAEAIRKGHVRPDQDNMLSITTLGRKAATDLRLVDPSMPDHPDSKVNQVVENVFRAWDKTKQSRDTQIVWLDLGTPASSGFNLYEDIKKKLVAQGVPEGEVAFIHDASTPAKRKSLFSKMRSGRVRILLASSKKAATGMNIQDRLIAAHHVDAPWKPADVEQRDGRILRQGNRHDEVQIYRYVTEGSFDAYMWQTLERKLKFITQLLGGKAGVDKAEDVGDVVLSYAEVKAIATGNPKIMEFVKLNSEVQQLAAEFRQHESMLFNLQMELNETPSRIRNREQAAAGFKQAGDEVEAKIAALPKDSDTDIKLGDRLFTKNKDAAEYLADFIAKHYASHLGSTKDPRFETQLTGELFGVKFTVSAEYAHWRLKPVSVEVTFPGVGIGRVELGDDARGNITRITNAVKSFPQLRQSALESIESMKVRAKLLEEKTKDTWPKEAELQEKSEQLVKLQAELDLEHKAEDQSVVVDDEWSSDDVPEDMVPEVGEETEGDEDEEDDGDRPLERTGGQQGTGGASGSPRKLDMPADMEGTGEAIGARHVIEGLERIFGYPIRYGRLPGKKLAGIWKRIWRNARLKGEESASIDVAIHELAHGWDANTDVRTFASRAAKNELKGLDYAGGTGRRQASEGFAEFVRGYLTEDIDVETLAPTFYEEFMDWLSVNPKWEKKLGQTKSLVDRFRAAGAEGRIRGQISMTGRPTPAPFRDRLRRWVNQAYQRLKEHAWFGYLFEKDLRSRGYKPEKGTSFMEKYKAFTQGGGVLANTAMENGVFTMEGGTLKRIGPSLWQAFDKIKPEDYDKWVAFAYARHALESWKRGKNPGITEEDAQHLYDKYRNNADWVEAANTLTEFNNALVKMLAQAEVISEKSARRIIDSYDTYLPLLRVVPDKLGSGIIKGVRLIDLPDPIKRRKGSGFQIIDPVQATVQLAITFYERAAAQIVTNEMVRASIRHGANGWIERVPPNLQRSTVKAGEVWSAIRESMLAGGMEEEELADIEANMDAATAEQWRSDLINIYRPDYWDRSGQPVARVMVKGEPELFYIQPDLFRTIKGMGFYQLPKLLDATFGNMTRMIRAGATTLNPTFVLRNFMRDMPTYLTQRDYGGALDPAACVVSYAYSEFQRRRGKAEDPFVKLWRQHGGQLSSPLSQDRASIRRAVASAVAGRHKFSAMETIIDIMQVTEAGPRLAEFKAVWKKHGYTREQVAQMIESGNIPSAILIEALNAAHEVTVDFRRVGEWGRWLTRMIPFLNARVEGLDKTIRTFKDNPSRTFARHFAYAVVPSIVYWLIHHDEDWYKEREDWLDAFWVITDEDGTPVARIPRGHEIAQVGAGVEAILDALYERDPESIKKWFGKAWKETRPELNVSGVATAIEVFGNWDFFRGREIVDKTKQGLKPKDQAYEYNTAIVKVIGSWLGVSPAKLEHVLEGVTGGMYRRVVSPVDTFWKGDPLSLADVPVVQGFVLRSERVKSVDEFYKESDRIEREYNSARLGGKDAPIELRKQKNRLDRTRQLMADLRDLNEGVKKRGERWEIEKYIAGLARSAMGRDPLERYPNPFATKDAPKPVRDAVEAHLGSVAYTVARPESLSADADTKELVEVAIDYLKTTGVSEAELASILGRKLRKSGRGRDTVSAWQMRFRRRVDL